MTPQEFMDKLRSFETCHAIAEWLNERKIEGIMGDGGACPLARAFNTDTGKSGNVGGLSIAYYEYQDTNPVAYSLALPAPARDFVSKFDNGYYENLVIPSDDEDEDWDDDVEIYEADDDFAGADPEEMSPEVPADLVGKEA